ANSQGFWLLELPSAAKQLIVESVDSGSTALPRATLAAWSNDGKQLYFTVASRTKWERGIVRYDRSTSSKQTLISDGRTYSNVRLSKDGRVATLNVSEGNRPPELSVADAEFTPVRPFVEPTSRVNSMRVAQAITLNYLHSVEHA